LKDHGETDQAVLTKLAGARYDADQVLGDLFPEASTPDDS